MTFDLLQVSFICLGYLCLIFGIAYATERGWIPSKIVQHPITYLFSLGIFASAWAFYGVVDLAFQFGYGALAYYLGTGALFLFAPVVLLPLAKLARRYQVHSLADLLVFRFHSHAAGALTTLCMLLGVLPLLALQLQAVADTLQIMSHTQSRNWLPKESSFSYKEVMAMAYCAILALFTILFGSSREQHRGLVTAMAFDSVIKVVALMAVGGVSVFGIFGGFEGLDNWLNSHPENLALLHMPVKDTSSHTLLLVFIATAVSMPHIFHMGMSEASLEKVVHTVTWAFPLFLLLFALPIFPILWAGFAMNVPLPAQYFTLGIPIMINSTWLTVLTFIGGLSAATGAMVVITLALTTMIMNHWLLPVFHLRTKLSIYGQLKWLRAIIAASVFVLAFTFFRMVDKDYSLTNLALISFIEALQFLPGIFAISYWPRGNRRGLIVGLISGTLVWATALLIPSISDTTRINLPFTLTDIPLGVEYWNIVAIVSLGLNVAMFILVSMYTKMSKEERYSAELCAEDELSHPIRQSLDLHTAEEFITRLSRPLGEATAQKEVAMALKALGLSVNERRPYALRRLRDKIEANLSGLLGIHVASEIIDAYLPYKVVEAKHTVDINLIESRLSQYRDHLTGLAGELNNLRLYHRKVLHELPMAVCSIGRDREVLMWNRAMVNLTQIKSDEVTGSLVNDIAEPWATLLSNFSESPEQRLYKHPINLNDRTHWLSLHKSNIEGPSVHHDSDQVIMIEDVTEIQTLEEELIHSERLASVGRLAAGVAHEIGNPITGIACLSQNLRYDSDDPEIHATADQILSQTSRVSRIVQSLVSFSHSGQNKHHGYELVSLKACADEACDLLGLQKEHKQVHFNNQIGEGALAPGDNQRLIQVFINLLSNARDASPADSEVTLNATLAQNTVTISVTDEGSGIAPEHVERILEPFFTTKDPGEGTGLGLAMVYSIIEDHDGQLNIISPANKTLQCGTTVTFTLPRYLDSDSEVWSEDAESGDKTTP